MSYETERVSIISRLHSNWNLSDGPINYENKDFEQPAGLWLDAVLIALDAKRASLGGVHKLNRFWGELQITIYVPPGDGSKSGNIAADKIIALFDNIELSCTDGDNINFETPKKVTLGLSNGRYRMVVRCPFYRDSRS